MGQRATRDDAELRKLQSRNKKQDWKDKETAGWQQGSAVTLEVVRETLALLDEACAKGVITVARMNSAIRALLDAEKI